MLFITFSLLLLATFSAPATAPTTTDWQVADTVAPPNIYRSIDRGVTWQAFVEGLPDKCSSSVVIDYEGGLLMASDQQRIFQLEAGATRWELLTDELPKHTYVSVMAARGKRVVAGTYRGHVLTSDDGGKNWEQHRFKTQGGAIRDLHFHGDWLLAGTDSGCYRSADGGKTWEVTDDGVQMNDIIFYAGRLYAARRDGILISDDDGLSWHIVYTGAVTRLLAANGKLYGLLRGGGMVRSKTGQIWERPLMSVPGAAAQRLPALLWGSFQPQIDDDLPVRSVIETELGWFASLSTGC